MGELLWCCDGPHPGTVEAALGATHTDELAVMCDTFKPLFPTAAALGLDDPAYPASWASWTPTPVADRPKPEDTAPKSDTW